MSNTYYDYFDVDEKYRPCIDESAINDGTPWEDTYPHETFVTLLNMTEKMLGGTTKRSLWIHGDYGTGKSKCAYAMRKMLEVPEEELKAYWENYEPLKDKKALLTKLIGHRERGVITAFRYASGDINTPQQLFRTVQECIAKALDESNAMYKGENTIKNSVIMWLEDSAHKMLIDIRLKEPKWLSRFTQSSADEIINTLKKSDNPTETMDNLFDLANEEGIKALTLTSDSLREWILDVIKKNAKKLVLVWDEFSDFFRLNRNSLSEFQKLVSICQEAPFYFVIVTHPITSLSTNDDSWKIVQQRFDRVKIEMPPNIAFELIGHAFKPKAAAEANWNQQADDLFNLSSASRKAVMKAADVKRDSIMKNVLPIHPMAALVLMNIATAYQANQRSMFDFIKTPKDLDTHAFQWFIQNNGPESDRPLLTVDMLWDFFYEKGRDYLSSDVKLILDTFPQQKQLFEKEKIVLQTILIMQAIDQRLGGTEEVLKPTDQNLFYAFEGDYPQYENECKNIAKGLVDKGILILSPIADGKKVYNTAILAGDSGKIEIHKKKLREESSTLKLVQEGEAIAGALSLTPALKLRYALAVDTGYLPVVTAADFTKTMDSLKHKDASWRFYAVLAVAKTEDEAQEFRNLIKETVRKEEYKDITVIDALSSPLGLEAFEQYVDYQAMSMYYQRNNGQQAKENARKAKLVLERGWKDRIHDGQFIVYSYTEQDGEKATGANAVHTILQTIVLKRYRKYQGVFDFTKGLSETQLKLTQAKQVSRHGIGGTDIKGLIAGCENSVLGKVWKVEKYWERSELASEGIVIIKKSLEKMISDAFLKTGKISIDEIYDYLEGTVGFSPCNLSAFVTGFLLKEYSGEPYRCENAEGYREAMTPDKLSEMIANYIGKPNAKSTYIVSLTDDEKAFYDLTEIAWEVPQNECTSPQHAGTRILVKMRERRFPVWCLEDVDTAGVFDLVKKYIELVQSSGDKAHDIAKQIGEIKLNREAVALHLKELLMKDNCKKGIKIFLDRFEGGALVRLAKEIGAEDRVLTDIQNLFSVEYSALWDKSTGEDEIRRLINEYAVVKMTNLLLNVQKNSLQGAFDSWRERLKFIGFSCESVKLLYPDLRQFFEYLSKIINREDMLPEMVRGFLDEMRFKNADIRGILDNTLRVFKDLYSVYLEGFSDDEIEDIKNSINDNMFILSETKSNTQVKSAAETYRKNQMKSQLFQLWGEKTGGTKNPRAWSAKYQTPILCLIDESIYSDAKKVFATLNSTVQSDAEIKYALEFIENADFFEKIEMEEYRNNRFRERIMGYYTALLGNINNVRYSLENSGIEAYEWSENPAVQSRIKEMALKEYNSGGSDKVVETIDKMSDDKLKVWLKELAKKDMDIGVKIILNGEE